MLYSSWPAHPTPIEFMPYFTMVSIRLSSRVDKFLVWCVQQVPFLVLVVRELMALVRAHWNLESSIVFKVGFRSPATCTTRAVQRLLRRSDDTRVDFSTQFDVVPVVFRHCSSFVFAFLNFPNFGRAEQFAEAANDAAASFDCNCTSYTSRSPLGMAASTYGRLHELHGWQHVYQCGAVSQHEFKRIVLVTRAGLQGAFSHIVVWCAADGHVSRLARVRA